MIRPNNPEFKLRRQFLFGFDWFRLSFGVRGVQIYFGPVLFGFNF